MSAADLLARLSGVRPAGKSKWVARCPAHKDKSPSLSIYEADDGKILVHCFAGCGIDEILGSIDLEIDALFPPREASSGPVRFPAHLALATMRDEIRVAIVCGLALEHEITPEDRAYTIARLRSAMDRVEEVCRLAGVK